MLSCFHGRDHATPERCFWQLLNIKTLHNSGCDGFVNNEDALCIPRQRSRHSACRIGECIFVFCGKDGTNPLKDAWVFNIGEF